MESPAPRDGADGTDERVLALHTEELSAREGDWMERSMRFFPTYKVSTASAETMAVMVKPARETDESASDVDVFLGAEGQ